MTLSNQKEVEQLHKVRIILTISLLTLSVVLFAGFIIEDSFLSISRYTWGSIPLILYSIYLYVIHKLDINFIWMEITREKIIFKYKAVTPFRRSKHARFEIPLKQFSAYSIQKSFFNLTHYLVFFQQVQGKRAKYPPVSLSGLSNEDREKLVASLEIILNRKQSRKK